MTAQEVYDNALILLDEVDEDGALCDSAAYEKKAPYLINMLQREIAKAEAVEPSKITGLSDKLVISDDSAERIMPYGLAAKLALADRLMEFASYYQNVYDMRFRQIGVRTEDLADDMNVMRGLR
jgi:hypothetical protein